MAFFFEFGEWVRKVGVITHCEMGMQRQKMSITCPPTADIWLDLASLKTFSPPFVKVKTL